MDEQRKAADRMSAPGHLTAEAGSNQGATLADQVNRMIALAEEARAEETWAFDALSRFVAGCAELGLDPLAAVEGARAREAAVGAATRESGSASAHDGDSASAHDGAGGAAAQDVAGAARDADAAPEVGAVSDRLLKVLEDIVRAGHDEGALRADVGAGDVAGVVGLLVRGLPTVPAGLGEELRVRAARLVLAGMRAHPAPVPPGAALTAGELARRVSG
ncbi:hypothetical protein HD597_011885 [Nonomuraea thailandensis]|uniref:Uncharacterized protein n=1 Tax=Nonomuraea thailandensis TaxID=1188745 RepID=A0A9X2GVU3_9ACTN|nr:hypothetical protein [Nonomuraea thailandensis]MCP2364865.1 hypothetical protein [Nonomuraea thailandensis]